MRASLWLDKVGPVRSRGFLGINNLFPAHNDLVLNVDYTSYRSCHRECDRWFVRWSNLTDEFDAAWIDTENAHLREP
ncbi:MAG: hypothetical protein WBD20_18305 [Pirellulaceae bacterium]